LSLTIIKFNPAATRVTVLLIGLVSVILAFYFVRWNFVNAVAGNGIDPKLPESRFVADWLPQTAPGDSQAHIAAAQYFEQTFEPDDLVRAQQEYETAVSLSPSNYAVWLLLARSRDRNGNADGATQAYAKALELAPNYAVVKWAYGNSLIRHGRPDDGFRMISDAAHSDPLYANQAVATALQASGGNVTNARQMLGDSQEVNAALTYVLAEQKRFAEAVDSWSRLDEQAKTVDFRDKSDHLLFLALNAHQYRAAAVVSADLITDGSARPAIGRLTNGDFESGIKLRGAGTFDWQIGEGSEPQIGLSEGNKHSGSYSLWLTFNSFEASSWRTISQTVALTPGGTYELNGFYRSALKTNAIFRWEIVDAGTGAQIAMTEPLVFAGDWTSMRARFIVPASADGVIVRLLRLGCGSGACPVTGKMAFDDLSIEQVAK
jgi:Tfp pilus assembly protein PilF